MASHRKSTPSTPYRHCKTVAVVIWRWVCDCIVDSGIPVARVVRASVYSRIVSRAPLALIAAAALWAVPASSTTLFQQRHIDMDTLIEGDSALASFPFVNDREQTISLEQVHTTCGCVVSAGADKSYTPGEQGTLNIDFSSSGLQGKVVSEAVAVFRVHADSTAVDSIVDTLTFTAFIKNELTFSPPSIVGMHTDTSENFTVHGELLNSIDTTIRLLSLTVEPSKAAEVLTRQLPIEVAPGDKVPFTLLVSPAAEGDTTGAVRGRVIAHVENTKYKRHYCDIRIFVE